MCTDLLVILHSPPRTSGSRTLQRVEAARTTIGCDAFKVLNLYRNARWTVNEKADPETEAEAQEWKLEVERAITGNPGGDVLLAYGVQVPPLPDRPVHHEKLAWLHMLLTESGRRLWMLGERAHHPSRWQRVTSRERPSIRFDVAMRELLTPVAFTSLEP